jgi:phasin family protein
MTVSRSKSLARPASLSPKRHLQAETSQPRLIEMPLEMPIDYVKETLTMTKEQFDTATNSALKAYEQFASIGKANIEAAIKTNAILAKGAEDIGKAWTSLAQRVVEGHMSSLQALFGCKNLKDVVDVQTDWAKTQMETVVAEGTKVSEMTLKVANESVQPLSASVNEAMKSSLKAA